MSPDFFCRVADGQLTDRLASALVCQALGLEQVLDSALVNALEAYCLPWRLVQALIAAVSHFAARHPTIRFSWKIRWLAFGVAIVDNCVNARWPAFVGVIMIAVLSWSTGYFQNRWERTCQDLRDHLAIAEGLGPDLAVDIRHGNGLLASSQRAERLRGGIPARPLEDTGPLTWKRRLQSSTGDSTQIGCP